MYFRRKNINEYVNECRQVNGAVLPNVRERNEFPAGHIRGAINLPLSEIQTVSFQTDTPLYVYCLRGSRSKRAAAYLKKAGYSDVRSIGGILAWKGEKVR